jgi:hypothetical protein
MENHIRLVDEVQPKLSSVANRVTLISEVMYDGAVVTSACEMATQRISIPMQCQSSQLSLVEIWPKTFGVVYLVKVLCVLSRVTFCCTLSDCRAGSGEAMHLRFGGGMSATAISKNSHTSQASTRAHCHKKMSAREVSMFRGYYSQHCMCFASHATCHNELVIGIVFDNYSFMTHHSSAISCCTLDLFPHFLQPHPQKHLPDLESVRSSSQMCSERNRKNDAECLLAFGVRGCFQHPPFEHVSIDLWRLRPRTIHDCLLGLESCALIATMVTGVPTPRAATERRMQANVR